MQPDKHSQIRRLRDHAHQRMGRLARELVDAASEKKENILYEFQFEQWMAEVCEEILD